LKELHRNALRFHAWALWHRACIDPAHAGDIARAEESGRAALATESTFKGFGDAPIYCALVPALLRQEKLDEADRMISDFEAVHDRWANLQQTSREVGPSNLTVTWGEVFELRGDLELRRRHYGAAVTAFERAAKEIDSSSSWFGLASAKDALGDSQGARTARARARGAKESYLVWLDH
jgi:hypothetical protein